MDDDINFKYGNTTSNSDTSNYDHECIMRLTYIYFLIAVTQGSHDFRFDMGRMGIRAGKFTSPEFFDKEVLVLLVRNMCESFDKNGKTKCAHKCFTQSKGFIL